MLKNKNKVFSIFYFILGLIIFMPSLSYAACISPAGVAGRIEYTSVAGEQVFKYCNGTDWVPWAGEPLSGIPAPQYSSGQLLADSVFESHLKAVNSATDEYCLTYETTTGDFEWQTCGGGAGAIDDLSDAATNYTNSNIFMGQGTGVAGTPGLQNIALGVNALDALDGTCATAGDCDSNTAIGVDAGTDLTLGKENVFVGYLAGGDVTTSDQGTYIGWRAGRSNDVGDANTYIGAGAGQENIGGIQNTFVGQSAGSDGTSGNYNTYIGEDAGKIATGTGNVFIGDSVGDSATSGDSNILIGKDVEKSVATAANELNIGNVIYGTGMYGTGSIGINDTNPSVALDVVGDINYTGVIVDVSDIRLKENVRPLQSPLAKLTSLNGFSFEMKGDPKHQVEYGVAAQDVQQVFPELVHQVDSDGTLGVAYDGLIAPMIEAIKEQQTQIEALQLARSEDQNAAKNVTNVYYTGVMLDVADDRVTENKSPIEGSLDKLSALNGFSYKLKGDPNGTIEYGLSAQDVQKAFPELVHTVDEEQGTLGVNYTGLLAPMLEAVKELKAENEMLKSRLEALEQQQEQSGEQ